ncbi:ATP-NAD kinase family protein [Spongiibacter sp. KMU-158]|uniref:ATP-NAD kinase family protein n=1 Tax=Spongiibacter pelagi TaxID=2760804 RepID=A0A927GX52_9GAMM|nr:ATP-NAD kinase family protein [Spongiibacter pelagi]MBD2859637.1 ATP-NAD kinase family protein [Spongiibacter pelagi]
MSSAVFKLGLVINPLAGLGGPLALKGSDDLLKLKPEFVPSANEMSRSEARCLRFLQQIKAGLDQQKMSVSVLGFRGAMAEQVVAEAGLPFDAVGKPADEKLSTPEDSRAAAKAIKQAGADLLVFVGGDGTARDMVQAIGTDLPALGLPAGVKMHSGVYAVSPEAAAEIVLALINGKLVDIAEQEVRDIDEQAFREGRVTTRYYGELLVPKLGGFLQRVKDSGREVEELAVAEIADEVVETMDDRTLYIVGPGSTTAGVMERLGLENTLLGFDLVLAEQLLANDLDAAGLSGALDQHDGPVKVLITAIGGQGHLLGRGNQQLTPELIRRVGRDNFIVLATKTKLSRLEGRPLLVDSNDAQLDAEWAGFIPVITGYRDQVMYRIGQQ